MKLFLLICGLLVVLIPPGVFAGSHEGGKSSGLKNTVILIIRHAEKPDAGSGLSAAGEARAQRYVSYFKNYSMDGQPLKLDRLFAAADSKQSHRPRLTIEPTSKALRLAIDSRFKDKQFQELADEIKSRSHGKAILIAWHHGEIPELMHALGADSDRLFPKGKWPEAVYDQLIELCYDSEGHLIEAKRIDEGF